MAPITIHRDHLKAVQEAIDALRHGATSRSVFGTTYSAPDLDATLLPLVDRLSILAAIEAIEQGHQSFSIGDRTFTKADLKTLYARRDVLERRTALTAAGGRRTRLAVPLT